MIIWAVDTNIDYVSMIVQDERTAILTAFYGKYLKDKWQPLTFELYPED